MKKELPFAVALLATGCLLCFSQFTGSSKSSDINQWQSVRGFASSKSGQEPAVSAVDEYGGNNAYDGVARAGFSDDVQNAEPGNMQASYQERVKTGTSSVEPNKDLPGEATENRPGNSAKPESGGVDLLPNLAGSSSADQPFPGQYLHHESNQRTVSFLAEVSRQISKSPPIGLSIELSGRLFGQVVEASGNYYQMGQGSHKSRIELSFGSDPGSPTVIQLCDGRFVYKLQTFGNQHSLEFVDLQRVRKKAGGHGGGLSPTGWVASGGIASMFQHLASAFNFGEIEPVDSNSVVMRGSWDEDALRQIVGLEGDPEQGEAWPGNWKQIPAQLPHAVELVFRRDENQNYFPKRIKFLKFVSPDEVNETRPMVELNFSAPRLLADVSDRYFVVNSTDLDSVDLTNQYIARINDFDQLEQTAAANETLDR